MFIVALIKFVLMICIRLLLGKGKGMSLSKAKETKFRNQKRRFQNQIGWRFIRFAQKTNSKTKYSAKNFS